MSRKLSAAAFALLVAGGVYLTPGTAQASNMGFKLERDFRVVPAFQNIYLLSFSLFNGLGDVGATTVPSGNHCVGDPGSAAAPDGVVDSFDALCDLWTDRTINGSFAFNRFDRDTCQFQTTFGSKGPFGVTFGGVAFNLERDAGMWITVSSTAPTLPTNRAVVVGSHDPSYTGRTIRVPSPDCTPRNDLMNLPYHTMYQRANEILCGLEGVDWVDADSNGNPDTCTRGIFDGTHAISVGTFDNIADSSVTTVDNQFSFRIVTIVFGRLSFSGPNFDLTPGDAYIASISPTHVPTTFLSPHF